MGAGWLKSKNGSGVKGSCCGPHLGHTACSCPSPGSPVTWFSLHTEAPQTPRARPPALAERGVQSGLTQVPSVTRGRGRASPRDCLREKGPAGPGNQVTCQAVTHLQRPIRVAGPGGSRDPWLWWGGSSDGKWHLQSQRRGPRGGGSQRPRRTRTWHLSCLEGGDIPHLEKSGWHEEGLV